MEKSYRYGEKGGLRYYAKKYQDFKKDFANKGYIELDIDTNIQKSFDDFLNKISPENEEKWIQKNYQIKDHNCQTFVVEALKILSPQYNKKCVNPANQKLMEKKSLKTSFIPDIIMDELNKLKI